MNESLCYIDVLNFLSSNDLLKEVEIVSIKKNKKTKK